MMSSCKSPKLCKPLEVKLVEAYYSLKLYNLKEASLFIVEMLESHKSYSHTLFAKMTSHKSTSINSERLGILMELSRFGEVQDILRNKTTPPERFVCFYARYCQIINQNEIENSIININATFHKQLTQLSIEIRDYITSMTTDTPVRIVNVNFSHFYYLLAVVYRILKQRNLAHEYIKKSICLFPYNIDAIELYSNLVLEAEELEDPIFKQIDPAFYSVVVAVVGLALSKTEDTKAMTKHAINGINSEFPSSEYVKMLKFRRYIRQMKNKKAIGYLQDTNLSDRSKFELSDSAARLFMKEQKERKLQTLVNWCLCYKKYDHRTLFVLGYFYRLKGMLDKAITYLEKGLKLNPFHYDALIQLGNFYVEQDKNNEAFECYTRALELNPIDPTPLGRMALLYEYTGKTEMAIGYYWKAIELNPFSIDYWKSISQCLIKGRAFDDALKCLKRLEAYEDSLFAVEEMVNVYRHQGDIENELACRLKLKEMYSSHDITDENKKTENLYHIACVYFNKRDFKNCGRIAEGLMTSENKFKDKAKELMERVDKYDFESTIFDESGIL